MSENNDNDGSDDLDDMNHVEVTVWAMIQSDPDDDNDLEIEVMEDEDGEEGQEVEEPIEETTTGAEVNYDISKPTQHSYLGGLDQVQGSNQVGLFVPGSIVSLKTIYLNGILLMPFQEIPLTFTNYVTTNYIREIIDSDSRVFGIGIGKSADKIGTTALIRSYAFRERHQVTIKVEGQQRFEIVEHFTNNMGHYQPRVRIMAEGELDKYYWPLISSQRQLDRRSLPFMVAFPTFVLRQSEIEPLIEQLKKVLSRIFESRIKNEDFSFPVTAAAFSYFVLSAMPFSDQIRIRLMKIICINIRLRLELCLLSENFHFTCGVCRMPLADRDSLLVMSKVGTSGTFVNAYGSVHELYTFSRVTNVNRISNYSEDYSWFPDYGWIIINCSRCQTHLGWEFETRKANMQPKRFWALTKNSLRLAFQFADNAATESMVYHVFSRELEDEESPLLEVP